MSQKLPLPKRFPDASFLVRAKVWTPERDTVEVEGPFDKTAGYLLLMVASNAHPTGKKLKAMKECLEILLKE